MVRLNKNHISLEVDLFGRVAIEKDVIVNANEAVDTSVGEHRYADRRQIDRTRNNYRGETGKRGT